AGDGDLAAARARAWAACTSGTALACAAFARADDATRARVAIACVRAALHGAGYGAGPWRATLELVDAAVRGDAAARERVDAAVAAARAAPQGAWAEPDARGVLDSALASLLATVFERCAPLNLSIVVARALLGHAAALADTAAPEAAYARAERTLADAVRAV